MRSLVVIALIALAACKPAAERRADSPGVQAIDTLKPVAATDTLPSPVAADSVSTKSKTPATKSTKSTKLGRDSAFGPPRNLPQLDTVRRRPPQ